MKDWKKIKVTTKASLDENALKELVNGLFNGVSDAFVMFESTPRVLLDSYKRDVAATTIEPIGVIDQLASTASTDCLPAFRAFNNVLCKAFVIQNAFTVFVFIISTTGNV